MYGPRHESRTLPWAKCQIFLETLFICNDIDKSLNRNFHSLLGCHFFKLLFLFLQTCAISSLKKLEKNGPRSLIFHFH